MTTPLSLSGPSTLILERQPEQPHEPDSVADAPLVGFDAFQSDRRIFGWMRLGADRLTDILNEHAGLLLVNVQLERLADGRIEWQEELRLDRDSLLAVRAGGPRGDPALRQPTDRHALVVQSGPYLIGGHLHARVGANPIDDLERRSALVPLSTGWLEHWIDGHRHRQWAGTILFNRGLVDALQVVGEGDLEFGVMTYPIRPGTAGITGSDSSAAANEADET